ncbi:MAG TPA: NAD(P)/FAD-dependent oxidoreductase [Burkholderiaceae bacterium]|nr:NAD(P)/FAD-dependent oxidoreductase [Burkholderiaceae bacterium]
MSDARRAAALEQASIPTLLMCVAQITGDPSWLEPPYRPQRDVSIFADPTGGLPEAVRRSVREAAARVLDELARGERALPPLPDDATLVRMMSVCLGERVPPEYARMAREEMGFADRDVRWDAPAPPSGVARMRTLVVGAGLSGVCAAWRLRELGVPVEIVEKNADVGGTWWDNDYPEAGVDTPNHFYSYSFAPNLGWTSNYSKRAEVLDYLKRSAEGMGVLRTVRLRTEVTALEWDEAAREWAATVRGPEGERIERYRAVVLACGPLSRPKLSSVPGIDGFAGDWFHTAQWRHDVPLEGKDVALIGTGASAMQCLRTVAERARSVVIYQRSPQWARPPQDYHGTVSPESRWLLENVPYYYAWYRFGLMWRFGDGLLPTLVRDPDWPHPERAMNARNDRHREQLAAYLRERLEGRPDLIEKALPHYPPYGKRILIDNGWFDALKRPNVELVTEGVARVEGDEIVGADGTRRRADVAILATGFEVSRMLGPMTVEGRAGATIDREWANDDPKAHLGITVPGFPNLFLLVGPGTGLAHGGSIFLVTECQVRWISRMIVGMVERGIDAVEVRRDVHDAFIARFDAAHRELVWSHPGMRNWYRNDAGRVFVPMPWRMVDYWRMTVEPDFDEFVATPAAAPATA